MSPNKADSQRLSEARNRLHAGNREFAKSAGIGDGRGTIAAQTPFAAILGCADARVPVEQIFNLAWNDVFVLRVAGNGWNAEAMGSLQYAVLNLKSIRVAGVLGHTSCGAVTAAVDAWLDPSNYAALVPTAELRAIVEGLLMPVRAASEFLEGAHGAAVVEASGYRQALIETAAVLNAAKNARILPPQFESLGRDVEAVFGVYDIATRSVGLTPDSPGLVAAPTDAASFDAIGFQVAESAMVRRLLDG